MKIVLTVERLVLDGLPPEAGDGGLVRAAMEMELTSLLSTRAMPVPAGEAVHDLPPVDLMWRHDIKPAPAGAHIAQAVHGALTREYSGHDAPAPRGTT